MINENFQKSGYVNCQYVKRNPGQLISINNFSVEIEKIIDFDGNMRRRILSTIGLVIDNKLIFPSMLADNQ
jgi:hypothetical protein